MIAKTLSAAAAVLVTAAAGVLVSTAAGPASAAAAVAVCAGADGVTVIVDYNEVGGPTRAGCDPDGAGKSASQVFPDAGFSLEYHPRQAGYVCKISGLPDDRPCLENDSFWSLWWSDGTSGEWRFSNQGVGGLTVPDGGYVAFAWHEGGGRAQPPDFAPTAHEEPVQPSEEPSDDDGGDGGNNGDGGDNGNGTNGGGTTDAGPTTVAPTTSAPTTTATTGTTTSESAPQRRKKRDQESTEQTSATSSSTVPGAAEITAGPPSGDLATDTSDDGGGALTTWVGLGLAVLVLGAAGLVTLLRRRSG
jgi:hypothetical protein